MHDLSLLTQKKEAFGSKILPFSLFQFTLGGFEQLQGIKVRKRQELGLPPLPEDSIRVIRSMRAASPPASASDLIEQQQKRARREHKVVIAAARSTHLQSKQVKPPYPDCGADSRQLVTLNNAILLIFIHIYSYTTYQTKKATLIHS